MVERAREMTLRFVAELDKMHEVCQEGRGRPPTDATVPPAGTPPPEVMDVTDIPAGVSLVRNAFAAAQKEESDDDDDLLELSGLHSKVAV
jgi:hypothetical protein